MIYDRVCSLEEIYFCTSFMSVGARMLPVLSALDSCQTAYSMICHDTHGHSTGGLRGGYRNMPGLHLLLSGYHVKPRLARVLVETMASVTTSS
jgi:hypothetical protein